MLRLPWPPPSRLHTHQHHHRHPHLPSHPHPPGEWLVGNAVKYLIRTSLKSPLGGPLPTLQHLDRMLVGPTDPPATPATPATPRPASASDSTEPSVRDGAGTQWVHRSAALRGTACAAAAALRRSSPASAAAAGAVLTALRGTACAAAAALPTIRDAATVPREYGVRRRGPQRAVAGGNLRSVYDVLRP